MEDIVSAVYIPENNIRQLVAAILVLFFHMIIKHPIAVSASVDLHVRHNDQRFRHFFRQYIVIQCCFQNPLKCSLKISIHPPFRTLDIFDFLQQGFPSQRNKFRLLAERHEKIVVSTPVPLCKVNSKTNRCRQRFSPHRTGNIRNDNCIRFLRHIIRQLPPLRLQYLIPLTSIQNFFHEIVRVQRLRMNLFFSIQCLRQILVKTLFIMFSKCVPVNHHGSSGDLRVNDLLPLSF